MPGRLEKWGWDGVSVSVSLKQDWKNSRGVALNAKLREQPRLVFPASFILLHHARDWSRKRSVDIK